ncbi:hypothetical protein [Pacificispira sp.]|uniref:hypothetical protein n=1 Tax=Pacificispira sp. TaxID=2888761 RepID=UPI003B527EA3
MLQDSDLETFLDLLEVAQSNKPANNPERAEPLSTVHDGLYQKEIHRLWRSSAIAYYLGDAPEQAPLVLERIYRNLKREKRYAPLGQSNEWISAIRWALEGSESGGKDFVRNTITREHHVGYACRRLRSRGFKVSVSAYGPMVSLQSQKDIAAQINANVSLLGGSAVILRIFDHLRSSGRYHDGMWLFGDMVPNVYDAGEPSPPMAWLLHIAEQQVGRKQSAHNPELAWKEAILLATDFAATFDCQRYSQFEQIQMEPCEFYGALLQSLFWREIFTTPQVPELMVRILGKAFRAVNWPQGSSETEQTVLNILGELEKLSQHAYSDAPTVFSLEYARESFPTLFRLGLRTQSKRTTVYPSPISVDRASERRWVFGAAPGKRVLCLPRSLLVASACDLIFRHIWSNIHKDEASKLVGDVIEKSTFFSFYGKCSKIFENQRYHSEGKDLEIDLAANTKSETFLIECKSKTLNSESLGGDMSSFLRDYANSFLTLLYQLARNEHNVRLGRTGLGTEAEFSGNARITKVAVSPLSFGPSSDKAFANSIVLSLLSAKLYPAKKGDKFENAVKLMNQKISQIRSTLLQVSPNKDGEYDVFSYMLDVFWLDLGQIAYVLHRGKSADDAFKPLRYATFSSRDFWTEIAMLDRLGHTSGFWSKLTR